MARLTVVHIVLICAVIKLIKVHTTNCERTLQTMGANKVTNHLTSYAVEIDSFMVFTKIKYRYALTMVFCQMRNPHPTQGQEAVFELDLPEDSFISNFTMEVNGRQYKSFIKPTRMANDLYANSKGMGVTAGIVNGNEDKYNFSISINLAANSSVLFFLEYEEQIPKVFPKYYEYTLNLIPEVAKVHHLCVDIEVLEYKPIVFTPINLRSKQGTFVILDLKNGKTLARICKEKYTIFVKWDLDGIMLNTTENRTRFIWEPTRNKLKALSESGLVGSFKLNYHFQNETESMNDVVLRNGHFVHRFDWRNSTPIPLYVIFVLDRSGSMIGLKGKRTKRAMGKVLSDLNLDRDFFHIITFSSSAQHWNPKTYGINRFYPASLQINATEYVNELPFEGSTNIYDALDEALTTSKNASSMHYEFCQLLRNLGENSEKCNRNAPPTPMIFFITDGYPTSGIVDRLKILKHVLEMNTNHVPIFSIGLGKEADHSLLETLSLQNHGIARQIYDDAQVEMQLAEFYQFVASPVLKQMKFFYTSTSRLFQSLQVSYSDHEPWLTSNDEIVVTGKLAQQLDGPSQLHLEQGHDVHYKGYAVVNIGDHHAQFTARICPCGRCPSSNNSNPRDFLLTFKEGETLCPKNEDDTFMERFWVHRTLRKLINEVVISGNETTKQEVINLSKEYNLVTPFTSLLILTPIDKMGSNMKEHNPPSVPDIVRPDASERNKIHLVNKNLDSAKSSRVTSKGYASPDKSKALPSSKQQSSLVSYLHSLKLTQEHLVKHYNASSSLSNTKLSIHDIKWIGEQRFFSLHLRNKNDKKTATHAYHLLRNATVISGSQQQKCIASMSKRPGKCLHVMNCVEPVYLTDIKLFVKGYFCPITESNIRYIGTCCTDLETYGEGLDIE